MNKWRPKRGWGNPHTDHWGKDMNLRENCETNQHFAYEAGADAMLESFLHLLENEHLCPRRVADDIKLFLGFIPDEETE